MHKITAQFYRYSKRVSELKSVWFLFCSGQVFFERTFGALLRPVQGTSLREDPWRPPASSSGDQSSRGPLAPSCVQFRGPVFERTPGALLRPVQGTSLREDPWRPPVSIQNFLFKMTSSPRALQIHPTRSYTDSDLFGYTLLKNKIIFLQNDKIIIMNYPYLFNYFYFY